MKPLNIAITPQKPWLDSRGIREVDHFIDWADLWRSIQLVPVGQLKSILRLFINVTEDE